MFVTPSKGEEKEGELRQGKDENIVYYCEAYAFLFLT